MAKKRNEEVLVEEILVEDVVLEEEEIEDEVLTEEVVIEHEEIVVPEKRVKVLLADNHKCCVGGEWYYLVKGKVYTVPENVKNILIRAGKLSPM